MTTDLLDFLRSRRSVRHFRQEQVPHEIIETILEVATFAPSAHHQQPWRFVVITDREGKLRLAQVITDQFRADAQRAAIPEAEIQARIERTMRRTGEAPVIILLLLDTSQVREQKDPSARQAEEWMAGQSVALAGLQLLLAAHAEGLGGVWICWPLFAMRATCQVLDLPLEWKPQGMVFIGYPAEKPNAPIRKPLAEIVQYI